ncbi:pyridoxal phosphate-dependent aminotransferase [Kordiimonas sp.]|uniref:pyridoxal phosphate-dependent aminotransferase n=1 Tax=Kordiimonas sp. TaxID=1970157 RepID=UPI003A953FA9
MPQPNLSDELSALDAYATKAMAEQARNTPGTINLAFGEPAFGPPATSKAAIEANDLNWDAFIASSKRYEKSRGMPELRESVASYYARRHGMKVDPEREVLITHGGVEAITLAVLATTNQTSAVAVTDPSYMLYSRAIKALGRTLKVIPRPADQAHEYVSALPNAAETLRQVSSFIVNSPENPSGYVLSGEDLDAIAEASAKHDCWIIHDEVYDSMAFGRKHTPARLWSGLEDRTLMINSFSKKYGVPGLRTGWLCGPANAIDLAAKLHDFIYLGVNIMSERIGMRMLSDTSADPWMDDMSDMLGGRAQQLMEALPNTKGFSWPRKPMGAMFAFPNVADFARKIPDRFAESGQGSGHKVANYFMEEHRLATIPGGVYGPESQDHLRMILCSEQSTFDRALGVFARLP